MKIEKLAPDTSIIIEGKLLEMVESKEVNPKEILIHEAILYGLEQLANDEYSIGLIGLDELKKLRQIFKGKVRIAGKRPNYFRNKEDLNEINSLVRKMAYEEGATLITSLRAHADAGEASGMHVILAKSKTGQKIKIEKFFDETTMSIHLKEAVMPMAKKGFPGKWEFVPLRKKPITQDEIKIYSREIIEAANNQKNAFIEIERPGSTIVQLGKYRIVITRPPFSDGWEITAVKPVKKLSLADYNLSEKLKERIAKHAEGILIAGAPGEGKTTIAAAIAEFYNSQNKIVKTIEAPRDLVLPESITQYAISHGDAQEIHDILLLSRPDYTVFDEMRNTTDFKLFADLRLSGIGLLGVVHATNAVDAIQRFVGRIELGVIPQVIDTVLFIKGGNVAKVLSLKMTVKVPSGMTEADLARPLTEIKDFETGALEYEIYTYGEETVVVPVKMNQGKSPAKLLAKKQIEQEMSRYTNSAEAEIVSNHKAIVYVPERDMPKIIGTKGKRINQIEKDIGISIDLQPTKSKKVSGENLRYSIKERGNYIVFQTKKGGTTIDTYIDDNYLFTSTTSKKGDIKISKKSKIGQEIIKALDLNKKMILKQGFIS
ncbi:MAG: PINc/VapC family ATPase [Nanoarchaeota archaeon]|nr:PINc/VapC family ATPase [Nanoarchaeota archaeon]